MASPIRNGGSEIASLAGIIERAVTHVCNRYAVPRDLWDDLWMEAFLAAQEALSRASPLQSAKEQAVFEAVVCHLKSVLHRYLPSGEPLAEEGPGEPPEAEFVGMGKERDLQGIAPLRAAILLALAPPSERRYVLHELLGWERPPRYCKARLKQLWQSHPWLPLLTGHVRSRKERERMLRALCCQARDGSEREREVAGFALVVIAAQELREAEALLVREASQALLQSPHPLHQLAGLWIALQQEPEGWDSRWIDGLDINALGAVLESRYAKPPDCECPSPLCLHHYPDQLQRMPSAKVLEGVFQALQRYERLLSQQPDHNFRVRGRLMAKALGLYYRGAPSEFASLLPEEMSRTEEMLTTVALTRIDPQLGLEHATGWLPKAPTLLERLLKAIKSPEPLERSSALYAARGLSADERAALAQAALSDPLVFVRFSVLRTLGDARAWEPLLQELLRPHEHKRLLHRCILNTLARADLERVQEIAAQVYLGQGKEGWREDAWLRHDAGYLLLQGVRSFGHQRSLEILRTILLKEAHPSPFVLLPAIQAFWEF